MALASLRPVAAAGAQVAPKRPRSLAAKLGSLGAALMLLALASVGLTLWITWQIEGGAAAVNEAGRLRMQTWRLAHTVSTGAAPTLPAARAQVERFDTSLDLLAAGDPARPLFLPRDAETHERFEQVRGHWRELRESWLTEPAPPAGSVSEQAAALVGEIDAFVSAIESQLARWTAVLTLVQLAMMGLAVAGGLTVLYASQLLVFGPLARLHDAVQRVQQGDLSVRVAAAAPAGRRGASAEPADEFGRLAIAFDGMTAALQGLYRNLETRVREKTDSLRAERERIARLYDASAFVARTASLPELAQGFAQRLRDAGGADAVLLRWYDSTLERHLLLASVGAPAELCRAEQGIAPGHCHCGVPAGAAAGLRVIPIADGLATGTLRGACREHGLATVVTVPVRLKDQLLGEADLLYRSEQPALGAADRSLLESLAAHLASGMESLRAQALEREAAAAEERSALARELHDSIAQGLAFLKIQLQLLRGALKRGDEAALARSVDELDTGIRDSTADVRELLLHFRTRTASGDLVGALQATLQKFQHQSGIRASLQVQGSGVPPAPDVQLQLLHVVQEALSNVRKHAGAAEVTLSVQAAEGWRIEVADDGRGFDSEAGAPDETHVGLRIMRERAAAVGARVQVHTRPGAGTRVVVTLDDRHQPAAGAAGLATPAQPAAGVGGPAIPAHPTVAEG